MRVRAPSGIAVVDTNVVVSGLITKDASSPVARMLDGMLASAFPFAVSEALLAEYRAVLVRPPLRKVHGLTMAEVDELLAQLIRPAIVLEPVPGLPPPTRETSSFGASSPHARN